MRRPKLVTGVVTALLMCLAFGGLAAADADPENARAEGPAVSPRLAGVVPPGGVDSRFDTPVDLVIETDGQLQAHLAQFEKHPEWFEGMNIGVVGETVDPVAAAGAKKLTRRDQRTASAFAAPAAEFNCAADLGVPSPTATGRWMTCAGSGTGGSYFVAAGETATDDPLQLVAAGLDNLTAPVPKALAERGYLSSVAGLKNLFASVGVDQSGQVVIDLQPDAATLIGGSFLLDLQELSLRTVLQYLPGAIVQFTLGGSCDAYRTAFELTRCALSAPDLQPRVKGVTP